jgi:3-polyprenyl-4-hydroxybenzoate decarboxylase
VARRCCSGRVKGSPWPPSPTCSARNAASSCAFGKPAARTGAAARAAARTRCCRRRSASCGSSALLASLLRVGRKRAAPGPAAAARQDTPPRLSRLPLLRTWSEDGGPFVTLPLVYTEHPEGLGSNLGMYRIQRFDDDTTGLHVQIGKGGGFHLAEYERLGRRCRSRCTSAARRR